MGDADGSYDFSRLDAFVDQLREGSDIVMGNRFQGRWRNPRGRDAWKNRMIGNPVLSGIGKLFFRCPVGDFHCGMRGFSRSALTGNSICASDRHGVRVGDGHQGDPAPARDDRSTDDARQRRAQSASTFDPGAMGGGTCTSHDVVQPAVAAALPRNCADFCGYAAGRVVDSRSIALTPHIVLDVHSLLMAFAAVLLGFQAVQFAVCARAYAEAELLPDSPQLGRVLDWLSLEAGLIVGGFLFLLGIGAILYTLSVWGHANFGPLDARTTLRSAIPGVAAMCLGGDRALQLPVEHHSAQTPEPPLADGRRHRYFGRGSRY